MNPLKPESFVFALRECLCQLVPDEAARAPIMALSGAKLGVSLRQLYSEISDWLRSMGVEPVPVGTADAAGARPGAPSKVKRTQLTLDKLRRLLSGELDPDRARSKADFSLTIPASFDALQDMRMVEAMMQRLAERANKVEEAASPERQAEMASKRSLGTQLGEEVVHLMLENLLQDDRLLPAVRAHLAALEPALLQLAKSDQRFFSEKSHPARQFLDRLTDRSLAFSNEADERFARFSKTFADAISVLRAGECDAAAFAGILHQLEAEWEREEYQQREQRETAARALLLVEQRNLLAQKMVVQFRQRMAQKAVPDLVQGFLLGPWAQVAAQAQLATADGTADPQGFVGLVDDLLWSVQPRLTHQNRGRLIQLLPMLIFRIRSGLQLIDYPAEQATAFFNELMALHAFTDVADMPRNTNAERVSELDTETGVSWLAEADVDPDSLGAGELLELAPDKAVAVTAEPVSEWSLEAMEAGAWVDLLLEAGWVRAQLTWASPRRTLFMFVSGGGHSHSMSKRTLHRLCDGGRLRLVSDGRVMQNALDAVAQTAVRNAVVKDLSDRLG